MRKNQSSTKELTTDCLGRQVFTEDLMPPNTALGGFELLEGRDRAGTWQVPHDSECLCVLAALLTHSPRKVL